MFISRIITKNEPRISQESPHDILERFTVKYMRGEISKEEFLEARDKIKWRIDLRRAGSKLPMGK